MSRHNSFRLTRWWVHALTYSIPLFLIIVKFQSVLYNTGMRLIHLSVSTKICDTWNSRMMSGIQSSWWWSGCNNSIQLLQKCQSQRNLCSPIPTLSSVVFKRLSTMLLQISPQILIPHSRLDSSKLIQSSDNIIIGLISPLTIIGLLVCEFPATYHCISEFNHPVLNPQISYDGLKEDFEESNDLQLLSNLNKAKQELFKFYEEHYAHHSSQDNTLQQSTTATPSGAGSSIPATSSFTARYQCWGPQILNQLEDYFRLSREPDLMAAIHWSGGKVIIRGGHSCIALLVISWRFQVC